MQLVIDIGNTRVKVGIFKEKKIIDSILLDSIKSVNYTQLIEKYAITDAIICSVANEIDALVSELSPLVKTLIFKADTPTPLVNLYQSKNTLGSDRMAAAVGGNTLFSNKNVLIIDAGTCLKYNFITTKNEYLGGSISPGLKMRFNALHKHTARLPLVETDETYQKLIGTTTTESILTGVQDAMVFEIEGFIQQYRLNYDNLTIVLTGGDTNFFEKRLKKPIFADPFLILKGLNEILRFNLT